MLQKSLVVVLGVASLVGLGPPAAAQPATARQQIQAAARRAEAGFAARDLPGFMALYADDFRGHGSGGSPFDRAGAERSARLAFATARSCRMQIQIERVTVAAGHADVLWRERTVTKTMGCHDYHLHTLIFSGRWQSVWAPSRRGWCMSGERQLACRVTRDGQAASDVLAPTGIP